MSKKIHIVILSTGEYSERHEHTYKSFYNKDKAIECVKDISLKIKSIESDSDDKYYKYNQILGLDLSICDYSYTIPSLYIQEVEIEDSEDE